MTKTSSLQEFLASPGSFTELNLSNKNIKASEAASIGKESEALQVLDLSNNSLADYRNYIVSLSNVKSLHTLNLSNTGISSWWNDKVTGFPMFASLQVLNLSCNPELGTRGYTGYIGVNLSGSNSLQTLDLSYNGIGQYAPGAMQHLARSVSLQNLNLSNNGIGSYAPVAMQHLASSASLQNLDLSYNGIGQYAPGAMQHLASSVSLQNLNLSNNGIESYAPVAMPHLARSVSLQNLNLSNNGIGSYAPVAMQHLASSASLQNLDLSNNGIAGFALNLAKFIIGLKSLQTLNLSNNAITNVMQIIIELIKSESLHTLNLSDNGVVLHHEIDAASAESSPLSILDLSNTRIGVYAEKVIPELAKIKSLTTLNLSRTGLSAYVVPVSEELAKFPSLKTVDLSSNGIGANAVVVAENLNQSKSLDKWYLSNNGIESDALAEITKITEEKAAAKKAEEEKARAQKIAEEKAMLEKAAIEKAAEEKAMLEKAAIEKAAEEKAEADRATLIKSIQEIQNHLSNIDGEKTKNLIDLSDLIAKGNELIPVTESSEQTILIMGNTGTGKTTLANILINEPLRSRKIKEKKIIEPVNPKAPGQIGHDKTSETTIPNKFEIDGKVIWDCPGFSDTNIAQAIANSFYIYRLANNNNSLKLILTIRESTINDRGGNFIPILSSFIKTFNNIDRLLESISLVVTHVDTDRTLGSIMGDISENLNANDTATKSIHNVINQVIGRNAVHLVYKPKEEGEYTPPESLLKSIEVYNKVYQKIAPGDVNVALSREDELELVDKLFSVTENNINCTLKLIQSFITNVPSIPIIEGNFSSENNILVEYHDRLVKPLLPDTRSDDKAIDEIQTKFTQLKQLSLLKDLFAEHQELDSIQKNLELMNGAIAIINQVIGSKDVTYSDIEGTKKFSGLLNDYSYILSQQYDYFKFLTEIITVNKDIDAGRDSRAASEGASPSDLGASLLANTKNIIKYCKEQISFNIQKQVFDLEIGAGEDFAYYLEAIEYLTKYLDSGVSLQFNNNQIIHKKIAQAEYHIATIIAEDIDTGKIDFENNIAELISHYRESIKHDKTLPEIYTKLGEIFSKQHEYAKSIKCYKVIKDEFQINECFKLWLQEDRSNPKIWQERGDYSLSIGQNQRALKYYGNAFSLSKDKSFKEAAMQKQADARVASTSEAYQEQTSQMRSDASNHNIYNFDMVNDEFIAQLLGVESEI